MAFGYIFEIQKSSKGKQVSLWSREGLVARNQVGKGQVLVLLLL